MKEERKEIKKQKRIKGITLVALVVTIVVLIILATISINIIFGEEGIVERIRQAKQDMANAEVKEQQILAEATNTMEDHIASEREQTIQNTMLYAYDEEIVVGTWKDGEKIYRRVYDTTTPSTDIYFIDISDLNIKEVFSLYGVVVKTTTSIVQIPTYNASAWAMLYINNNNIGISATSDHLNCPIKVIIDYTKNTETETE